MARNRNISRQVRSGTPSDIPYDVPSGPIDVYANSAHVVMSTYECLIEFSTNTPVGEVGPANPAPTLERSDVCRVRMSPQHAKSVAAILATHVKKYEETFGRLALPPDMLAMWDEVFK